MKKIIFTILVINCLLQNSYAQPITEWVKRYTDPGNRNVYFVDMATDKVGNVFVTGYIYVDGNNKDILTLKYDSQGALKWVKTYDSPVHRIDVPNDIAVDNSGDVIIAGYSLKTSGLDDYFVIKYGSNGDSLWSSRITYQYDTMTRATSIAVDDSDNVYVVGFFDRLLTGASYLVKYNKLGDIKWKRYYKLGDSTGYAAIDVAVSKNYFIYTLYVKYNVGHVVIKYDMNGNQIWLKSDSADKLGGLKILLDKFDNSYIGGIAVRGTYNDYWFGMTKRDSSGNKQWIKTYHNQGDAYSSTPNDIAIDGNGNSFITGVSGQNGQMGWDYVTIKYNPVGDSVWVKRYNPLTASDDWALSVATDKYGNAYVTGKSNRYNWGYGYTTIKYTPTGIQSWVERYDGGAQYSGISEGKKILLDSNLNIYVSGNSNISGINEIATIKYSQTTSIRKISQEIPDKFLLYQNYPNPFNPITKIKFDIPAKTVGQTFLSVYDILGKEVSTLVNESALGGQPGTYSVDFDGTNFPSGIYFYRLTAGNFSETRKMMLIK